MFWRILVLILLVTVPGWTDHGKKVGPAARCLPVLCYHEICPKPQGPLEISVKDFTLQMNHLKKMGYQPVRLEEARKFFWGSQPLPGKPILITFDDGYEGVYRYAVPILLKNKFPASMFLVVGHVGAKKPMQHLTWDELKSMRDGGLWEFGSHTYDLHCYIRERLQVGGIYPNQVVADLRRSRQVLKEQLGVDATAFAWPYGHYNAITIPLAAKAGFNMQFTTDFGATRPYEGTLRIRRFLIQVRDRDIREFGTKLARCVSNS